MKCKLGSNVFFLSLSLTLKRTAYCTFKHSKWALFFMHSSQIAILLNRVDLCRFFCYFHQLNHVEINLVFGTHTYTHIESAIG